MGIIAAAINSVGGALGDTWLEAIEPVGMTDRTVMCPGANKARNDSRNTNKKGTDFTVSNGSMIHVYQNQMMLLVDNGAIIDYTCKEGAYQVSNSSLPSLMNGQFGDALKDTFTRFKFGGTTPTAQRVFYINLRPLEGIRFGTKSPVTYYDENYQMDLKVRAFGKFSIEIVDPILFFKNVIPNAAVMNCNSVDMETLITDRYIDEFLGAFGEALTKLSEEGVRISRVNAKNRELAKYMVQVLEEDWTKNRGIRIQSVGIANIDYDEKTAKLLDQRNERMLDQVYTDPAMLNAMMQRNITEGVKAAGSNANGAAAGFMGVGLGTNFMGGYNGANQQNAVQQQQAFQQQRQAQQHVQQPVPSPVNSNQNNGGWTCSCGKTGNTGKFCAECGNPKPAPSESGSWTCSCGAVNTGKFCAECGSKRPDSKPKKIVCDKCGYQPDMNQAIPKFCPNCGDPINEADFQ